MTIGILGGGQLGRMLALAGIPMGFRFRFLDPSPDACAGDTGHVTVGSYTDEKMLRTFAEGVDIVTYEFENIPVQTVELLEKQYAVHPSSMVLRHVQSRVEEKKLCTSLGIPVAPYMTVDSAEQLSMALQQIGYPAVLKTCSLGYDGKGQCALSSKADISKAEKLCTTHACILEKRIPFSRELSLIVTRSQDGSLVYYPLTENVHAEGILRVSRAPAKEAESLFLEATMYAKALTEHLSYVGTMTIEFFQENDHLLLNEIAPRVHNSGHWTIEGAETSQFENHLRAIAGLPLGPTTTCGFSAMVNILGSYPDLAALAALEGVHPHFYRKKPLPKRKIGHITVHHFDEKKLDETLGSLQSILSTAS
jgi:5-(carboxyamino)imidazole ribonucleotide synthase